MYEEFLRDPAAVGPEWRRLFESGVVGASDGGAAGQRGSGEAGKPASGEAGKQVSGEAGKHASGEAGKQVSGAEPQPTGSPVTDRLTRLPASPPAAGLSPIKGPAAKLVA